MVVEERQRRGFARAAQLLALSWASPAGAVILAIFTAVWLVWGILTDFPRVWELAITVGFPPITLALLIGIQHTQNHDDTAMQLKMDELIRVIEGTRGEMMNVEDADRPELDRLQDQYRDKDTAPSA